MNQISKDAFGIEFEEISRLVEEHQRFLVIGHVDPDGDCIGSMLAITLYLKGKGKEVKCFAPGDIAERFLALPSADAIVSAEEAGSFDYDAVFTVDTPTADRMENMLDPEDGRHVVNIDHHPGNQMFGDINVVDEDAAAAAIIVFRMLQAVSPLSITPDVASCLYLGILMDTGGFRFTNAGADAMYSAGRLIELGAKSYQLTHDFIYMKKFRTLKLLGKVLESLEIHFDGKIATMLITREMLDDTGGSFEDSEGFVDYGAAIDDVELIALLREIGPDRVRVSLRSRNHYDVSELAGRFGGGGHAKAAGLTLTEDIETARTMIIEALGQLAEQKV